MKNRVNPDHLGSTSVTGMPAVAGQWSTFVVTHIVGTAGLTTGGTLRLQFPDSWHAWRRNGAKGVQSTDPASDNYVTARVARGDAALACDVEGGSVETVVKSNRIGLDGRDGRYVYVLRVTVTAGRLVPGDRVEVLVGDTAGGSRGFAAGLHPEGPERVMIAIDPLGSGEEVQPAVTDCPVVEVIPGRVVEILAHAPSDLGIGETGLLHLVAIDAEGNRCTEFPSLSLREVRDGDAQWGEAVPGSAPGTASLAFTAAATGVLRLTVRAGDLVATSNPTLVHETPPRERRFWGDLHSHADHSFDGVGHFPYEYARDVARLDFYALTEHCERWRPGDWEHLQREAARFHEPGRFVTFLAYEATFHEPWGHHNVYFREPEDAVVVGAHTGTVLDLWKALAGRRALTVPHHTGVAFSPKTAGSIPGSTSPAVDWSHHDPEFRRTVEIYSGHGQSEFYDPGFDLSYENSDFSTNTSRHGPHYARDAWERGHDLGVIGSSDNHRAQPGRGELGLAAVVSPSLERGAVFDALHDRNCYATTGSRILLDVRVGSARMGGTVHAAGPVEGSIAVAGTGALAEVEIFVGLIGVPGSTCSLVYWAPDGWDFSAGFTLPDSDRARFVYARVRQHDSYRGRRPTAWSSPVQVLPGPAPASAGQE